MRLWVVALIVGTGCASAERGDTTRADLARREEAPARPPAPTAEPAPEFEWHDLDSEVVGPRVAEGSLQWLRPFDVTAAKVGHEFGCRSVFDGLLPDETNRCLWTVDISDCGYMVSNGIPICMKRIHDGALSTTSIPLESRDEWTSCDEADREKAKWPACRD